MARFEKVSKSMKKHEPSNRQKEKGKVFYNLAPYLTNITHAFRLPFQNFPRSFLLPLPRQLLQLRSW